MSTGIALLIIHNKKKAAYKDYMIFQGPYLKNGAIGLIFYGFYYLIGYLSSS